MGTLWQDVKYSLRQLLKSPCFTVIALITLAIGIGANTIMFSVVDLIMFRPPKIKKAEQLVCCNIDKSSPRMRYTAYQTLRENNLIFEDIMARDTYYDEVTLMSRNTTRKVYATYVSSNYFSVLGVAPVLGRGFLPEEVQRDAMPVAVLSYRTWQNMGSDAEIIGQYVNVNGVRCQIIGVAPEGFTGIIIAGPEIWLPLSSQLEISMLARGIPSRDEYRDEYIARYQPHVAAVARLKAGQSIELAQARFQTLLLNLKENYPDIFSSDVLPYLQRPGRFEINIDPEVERAIMTIAGTTLMGITSMILVIACMNLANMLVIQGANHHREIAIRLALGSTRWIIIRQLLIESLLLALVGGALALIITYWGIQLLNYWVSSSQFVEITGLQADLSIRVITATVGLSVITAMLFGFLPALGLSRSDLTSEMKESGNAMFLPVRRKKRYLSVTLQIALAVVFVMYSVLSTRGYLLYAKTDSGIRMDNKLVIEVEPIYAGYDSLRGAEVCQSIAELLESMPAVKAVGTSPGFTFGGSGMYSIIEYEPGRENDESRKHLAGSALNAEVGRDYFTAMEIPLLQGRYFNRLDSVSDAEKVAIIDETLARKLRPDGNALDCMIQHGVLNQYSEPYRVIGIVPNIQGNSTSDQTSKQMYRPLQPAQKGRPLRNSFFYLLISDNQSISVLKQRIRDEIRRIEPWLPIISLETLSERHYNDMSIWAGRFAAQLSTIAGATALFLAALGIYAVRAYVVASRTTEIGIRMAIGATRRDILLMILRESIRLTLEGLIVGFLLAYLLEWIIRIDFFGVSPVDPVSIVLTVIALALASLLASYVPARRAARLNPMEALRYE